MRASIAYKIVVTAMALSWANYVLERLNLTPKPISPREIVGLYVSTPEVDMKPMMPSCQSPNNQLRLHFSRRTVVLRQEHEDQY